VAGAGLIEAGAGSLNVAAAVAAVEMGPTGLRFSQIANETVRPSGITYVNSLQGVLPLSSTIIVWGDSFLSVTASGSQTVWLWRSRTRPDDGANTNGQIGSDIIVWGDAVAANILVWGNIIVWGDAVLGDIIVWGDSGVDSDIIVWGD
jgi:hypothetical protein